MNSDKIKILHIIKSLGRGGAEMLLPETLKLHDKTQFEFHYIYFLPWKDQMVESIRQQGAKVTCFKANNNLQLMTKARQVARYVKENKIQVIHAHLPWAGILARRVAKMCSIPVLYTEHNKQERYHWGTRTMNLLTMNALNTVIAVSADVAESIQKHKPNLKIPVRTILNGVNTSHFRRDQVSSTEIRDALNIPAKAPVIGTIAVFRFQKRLDVWMEMAAEILRKFPETHFIVVGDGPLKNELMAKRDSLGLATRLHMPGLKTEVRPYLAAFDLYMMSSVFEGLPIALLEAMAMECPIVTTDAGGIREVIRHEEDGLLCGVENPQELVTLATGLLSDDRVRLGYGTRARQRVLDHFSMEKMVAQLEALYRQTASR
ncbi:Glycosyltransferase involved in cell wall bisynthesis [Chryseolinea serpens]|uniref:Glycosyltransferase involved in cell wall bisynthesis n=1 Tax=Chryseolinea serpens TaxID=947013 RepID=A0A1M5KZC3_9BACT|nr:glycosyltransferase [Chryseolinea serpens]SHG57493.1 Glycosyltransferase involved in cell wall bisynthesis [Chryseolinea serpens]